MPRIRSIKPEFFTSQSVGRLSRNARLVMIGLISQADDEGRFRAAPRMLAGAILPYDEDAIRVVVRSLSELEKEGIVQCYSTPSGEFGVLLSFPRHQHLSKPAHSKLPSPLDSSVLPRKSVGEFHGTVKKTAEDQGSGIKDQGRDQGSLLAPLKVAGRQPAPASRAPRESDLLCADFLELIGSKYGWNGAKDGEAFAWCKTQGTVEEIRTRWRRGLKADGWLRIATVAQLRQKWNDLATAQVGKPGAPIEASAGSGENTSQVFTGEEF